MTHCGKWSPGKVYKCTLLLLDFAGRYHYRNAILAAGTAGEDKSIKEGRGATTKADGLVPGHAYSVIDVKAPISLGEKHRLVCLRNPWGSFEWSGAWSDNSPLWNSHPLIRAQCRPNTAGGNDGTFWMAWEDFCKHFDTIDCCFRRSGMSDLVLDVKEELGQAGPCVGCMCGCAKYWLCCQGPWKLLCAPQCNSLEKEAAEAPGEMIESPIVEQSVVGSAFAGL